MTLKTFISTSVSLLLSLFCLAIPSWAIEVSPGDRVELQARNRLGVPLHETASSSLVGRAPDGTIAEVLDTANDQRWVAIEFEGFQRWVTERYIRRVIPALEAPMNQQLKIQNLDNHRPLHKGYREGLKGYFHA